MTNDGSSVGSVRGVDPAVVRRLSRFAQTCHEEVSRQGEAQPCDKPAVAARLDDGEGGGDPYPVCAYHARAPMVRLADLLAASPLPEGRRDTETDLPAGYSGADNRDGQVTDAAGEKRPRRGSRGVTESPAGKSSHPLPEGRPDGLDALMDQFIAEHFAGRVGSGIAKMAEEVAEFAAEPTAAEGADVLICLLVELRQRGSSLAELLAATEAKAHVNLSRTWEWQPDGTIHHVAAPVAETS